MSRRKKKTQKNMVLWYVLPATLLLVIIFGSFMVSGTYSKYILKEDAGDSKVTTKPFYFTSNQLIEPNTGNPSGETYNRTWWDKNQDQTIKLKLRNYGTSLQVSEEAVDYSITATVGAGSTSNIAGIHATVTPATGTLAAGSPNEVEIDIRLTKPTNPAAFTDLVLEVTAVSSPYQKTLKAKYRLAAAGTAMTYEVGPDFATANAVELNITIPENIQQKKMSCTIVYPEQLQIDLGNPLVDGKTITSGTGADAGKKIITIEGSTGGNSRILFYKSNVTTIYQKSDITIR